MKYFNELKDQSGIIYSIDMIRVKLVASVKTLQAMASFVLNDNRLDDTHRIIKHQQSFADSSYQHFFSIEYIGYGTVKIGLCMLGATRDQYNSGYIEFNPNKLFNSPEFCDDYDQIIRFIPNASLLRFDLAIDIPVSRDKVMLVKDNRAYTCMAKSSVDKTEYLGKRNHTGRVKLYNKQIEQQLDYPLTRLEVTCDEDYANIPTVIDLRKVPKSDSPLLTAIAGNPYGSDVLSLLSPYHRRKILTELSDCTIKLDQSCIDKITAYAVSLASGRLTWQFNHTRKVKT